MTDERWRELLTPDGSPKALTNQRRYVRLLVGGMTGVRPSLKHLTIGQAQRIIEALELDPGPLWTKGRGSVILNRMGTASQWFLSTLGIVVLCFIPWLGWLTIVGLIVGLTVSTVHRRKRQAYEDMLVTTSRTGEQPNMATNAGAVPPRPLREPAPPVTPEKSAGTHSVDTP